MDDSHETGQHLNNHMVVSLNTYASPGVEALGESPTQGAAASPTSSLSNSDHHHAGRSSRGAVTKKKRNSDDDDDPSEKQDDDDHSEEAHPKRGKKKQRRGKSDASPNKKPRKRRSRSNKKEHAPNLTTTIGQKTAHPELTELQARAAAKREYNRQNAARARERNKQVLGELQEKYAQLSERADALARENEVLRGQLQVFQPTADVSPCAAGNGPAVLGGANHAASAVAQPSPYSDILLQLLMAGRAPPPPPLPMAGIGNLLSSLDPQLQLGDWPNVASLTARGDNNMLGSTQTNNNLLLNNHNTGMNQHAHVIPTPTAALTCHDLNVHHHFGVAAAAAPPPFGATPFSLATSTTTVPNNNSVGANEQLARFAEAILEAQNMAILEAQNKAMQG